MSVDKKEIQEQAIRLTGKAYLPDELEIGNNYQVITKGSITSMTETDLQDGKHLKTYKFEPVLIEIVDDLGKSIKAKDVRKTSQRMRSRSWLYWKENNISRSDDDFWDWVGMGIIKNFDEIVDFIKSKEN